MEGYKGKDRKGDASKQDRKGNQSKDTRNGKREDKAPELVLDNWQRDVLECKGNILLCTGRQVGKTYIFARKAAERLVSQEGCRIIVGSLTEDQAQLMIMMVLSHLERYYKAWIKRPYSRNVTKGSIILNNGSKILARAVGTTGDAFRGFTGDVLIPDEASRMPELMWAASKPTLMTTGGEIWMCSTPYGRKGYFYECYQNKHNRFTVFNVSSEDVIHKRPISEVWTKTRREEAIRFLEDEKNDMSELEYAQEYLAKFIDDLRQLYSDKVIYQSSILKRKPISRHRNHFLGCDIARLGEDEGTFEVIDKIDRDNFQHVENIITRKKLTTETFDRIVELENQWGFKKIGIDAGSGSLGVAILDFLLKEPIVKRKVVALNNLQVALDHLGEKTRKILKEDMYLNMLALMEKGKLKLLDDKEVQLSLKSVQYEYIRKEGMPTKIRIFGRYTHIVEGLVRASWLANQKHLNTFIDYV